MRKVIGIIFLITSVLITSCNSNDDSGTLSSVTQGIKVTNDSECCSAEEALRVYNFLQTVRPIPELTTVVDGKYTVTAYSKSGKLHTGYNDIYFVATKNESGNYIKDFQVEGLKPLMLMTQMQMKHSTPVSSNVESFDLDILAVKRGWISFLMSSSDGGSWTLAYDATVLGAKGSSGSVDITVDALPAGQQWVKSFKYGDDTYYLTLVDPTVWKTGTNTIKAYVSKKSSVATEPYRVVTEQLTIETVPTMPDMGNHTSPGNTPLTIRQDNSYEGILNLTMTGLWRIHLTVRNAEGTVIAGGDDLNDGFSSLYWDVTL